MCDFVPSLIAIFLVLWAMWMFWPLTIFLLHRAATLTSLFGIPALVGLWQHSWWFFGGLVVFMALLLFASASASVDYFDYEILKRIPEYLIRLAWAGGGWLLGLFLSLPWPPAPVCSIALCLLSFFLCSPLHSSRYFVKRGLPVITFIQVGPFTFWDA